MTRIFLSGSLIAGYLVVIAEGPKIPTLLYAFVINETLSERPSLRTNPTTLSFCYLHKSIFSSGHSWSLAMKRHFSDRGANGWL